MNNNLNSITIFNKIFTINFVETLREINSYEINYEKNIFIIKINIKYINNENKKINILNSFVEEILIEYLLKKQKEFSKIINVYNPPIFIKNVNSFWGKNSTKFSYAKGKKFWITYNLKLIRLDKKFIDYVIQHELIHFLHRNHSNEFYSAGEKYFPGFYNTDRELNKLKFN
ncbi:Protein of uncharacterised function DUF45 [Mycoplasmopsis maculosa]|uniref:Protein of uncharacterized function DUF45 n=1 Tax=Mycoplasmopsis maculosa TaxID=114885 RepID=A0A449B3J1_9BACT|nr:YgjP-like metallopeptidase domain-containing protein [Mycoplasmopsis maculosa]VEU75162.1 Protein of uncharacterised function DUF45 [Mycoplasmopsis maculosa]